MPSDPRSDGAAASGAPEDRFAQPRRLHPFSILLGIDVRRLIQVYLVPAFATFAVAGMTLTVAAIIAGAVLIIRVLEWQRFRFSFDGSTLRVDQGVISRDHRAFDVARIQQVGVDRTVAQRIFGLATLRVETAGGSGETGTIELRVLPEDDALVLRAAVVSGGGGPPGEEPGTDLDHGAHPSERRRGILRVPLRHIILGAVTGARLLVFPAVIAGLFQFGEPVTQQVIDVFLEVGREEGLVVERDEIVTLTLTGAVVIGVALLVLSVMSAIAVAVLRDARYRIEQEGDEMHVSRGLLATRSAVLPFRRVQQVEVRANWLRRLLGYTAVRIDSAGGSTSDDRRVTIPLLPAPAVDDLLAEVFPGVPGVPPLRSHPRGASRRAVARWLRVALVAAAVPWVVPAITPLDWLAVARYPVLAAFPMALVLGVLEYRLLAHGTSDRLVAARQGVLSVRTSVAPLAKIQGASRRDNPFQRRLGVTTVIAHVAGPGGDVEVLDIGTDDAGPLRSGLTEHAAGVGS